MSVHRRVPIVTTAKGRSKLSWGRHIRIAVKHVRNFVWIFLVHTRQREFRKTLRRFRVECRSFFFGGGRNASPARTLACNDENRQQTESEKGKLLHWTLDVRR